MAITPEPKIVVNNEPKSQPKEKSGNIEGLLHRLVAFEGEALQSPDRLSLKHIAVNKSRILLPLGHAFLCTRTSGKFSIEAISNQAIVNNNAPFLQWLKHILKSMHIEKNKGKDSVYDFAKGFDFTLKTRRADDDFDYPFSYAFWAPFAPDNKSGGMLFTRDKPWDEKEFPILTRVGQIIGVSWAAHTKTKVKIIPKRKKYLFGISALILLAIAALPVPITSLAPAEIIAKDPFIVTSAIDGVIDEILVKPGTMVKKGTLLARLNDTAYRNEYTLSGEEKAVASARYQQASLSAFIDPEAKRELAITRAEQTLAAARQNYARDRLAKTRLIAPHGGLVIYSDEKDWAGRPISIGEKIMQIADPTSVLLRIESPIADSGTLRRGARVRMFLDSDPLRPIEGTLTRANFYALPQAGGQLAYESYASLETDVTPRIGGRGVAKVYGEKAPLGYWLLRKPISSVRQFFGL